MSNAEILKWIIETVALFASLTFHEFSHAAAATYLGDETPKRLGRLTLNPLAHLDWTGALLLLTVRFGWGKPVPFNPYNLRAKKWGPVMVAAAGPASNVLLALAAALALKALAAAGLLAAGSALVYFLASLLSVNVMLFAFNLIPLPPLDGSHFLLMALEGPEHARTRWWLETRGPIALMVLLLADWFVFNGAIFGTLYRFAFGTLLGIVGLN